MLNCEGETTRALLPSAGVPFADLILSQLIAWPLDVTSFCELGVIKIELDITDPCESRPGVRGRTRPHTRFDLVEHINSPSKGRSGKVTICGVE